jgi:rhodanese-related sulfurtransferase
VKVLVLSLVMVVAAAAPAGAEVVHVSSSELAALLAEGVPVVDVRQPEEWRQTGVVEGSHLLTFFDSRGRYDARAWLRELSSVADQETPVILICRTGNRTRMIADFLDRQVGYRKVYNVSQGIVRWINDGRPTVAPR